MRSVWCVCAFVCRCSACGLVLELEVCRVRFARVSCPRLRFGNGSSCNYNLSLISSLVTPTKRRVTKSVKVIGVHPRVTQLLRKPTHPRGAHFCSSVATSTRNSAAPPPASPAAAFAYFASRCPALRRACPCGTRRSPRAYRASAGAAQGGRPPAATSPLGRQLGRPRGASRGRGS